MPLKEPSPDEAVAATKTFPQSQYAKLDALVASQITDFPALFRHFGIPFTVVNNLQLTFNCPCCDGEGTIDLNLGAWQGCPTFNCRNCRAIKECYGNSFISLIQSHIDMPRSKILRRIRAFINQPRTSKPLDADNTIFTLK